MNFARKSLALFLSITLVLAETQSVMATDSRPFPQASVPAIVTSQAIPAPASWYGPLLSAHSPLVARTPLVNWWRNRPLQVITLGLAAGSAVAALFYHAFHGGPIFHISGHEPLLAAGALFGKPQDLVRQLFVARAQKLGVSQVSVRLAGKQLFELKNNEWAKGRSLVRRSHPNPVLIDSVHGNVIFLIDGTQLTILEAFQDEGRLVWSLEDAPEPLLQRAVRRALKREKALRLDELDEFEGKKKQSTESISSADHEEFARLIDTLADVSQLMGTVAIANWAAHWIFGFDTHSPLINSSQDQIERLADHTVSEAQSYERVLELNPDTGVAQWSYRHRVLKHRLRVIEPIQPLPHPKTRAPKSSLKTVELERRVRAYQHLIDLNFSTLKALKESDPSNSASIETVMNGVETMARAYEELVGSSGTYDTELNLLRTQLAAVMRAVRLGVLNAVGSQQQKSFDDLVQKLNGWIRQPEDIKSFHDAINFMHQRAIGFLMENTRKFPDSVKWDLGIPFDQIAILNITRGDPRRSHLALDRLHRILRATQQTIGERIQPEWNVLTILEGQDVWMDIPIGNHSAQLHVNYSPTAQRGRIVLKYVEGQPDEEEERCAVFAEILRAYGFRVTHMGGRLEAVLSNEEAQVSVEALEQLTVTLLRMLLGSVNLDVNMKKYDSDGMAPLFLLNDSHRYYSAIYNFENVIRVQELQDAYDAEQQGQDTLRHTLNHRLEALELPQIPATTPLSHRAIQTYFNKPLLAGLAAGLYVAQAGQSEPRLALPVEEVAAELLDTIHKDVGESVRIGALAEELRGYVDFRPVLLMGGYVVEQAVIHHLDDTPLIVWSWRNVETDEVAFGVAYSGVASGKSARGIDELLKGTLNAEAVVSALASLDIALPQPRALFRARTAALLSVLETKPSGLLHRVSGPTTPVANVAESPLALGTIYYFGEPVPAGENPVLVVPFTSPEDVPELQRAGTIVTTNPNATGHTAIFSREAGIRSVAVRGQWRSGVLWVPQWSAEGGHEKEISDGETTTTVRWGIDQVWVPWRSGQTVYFDAENQRYGLEGNIPSFAAVLHALQELDTTVRQLPAELLEALKEEDIWQAVFNRIVHSRLFENPITTLLLNSLASYPTRFLAAVETVGPVLWSSFERWHSALPKQLAEVTTSEDLTRLTLNAAERRHSYASLSRILDEMGKFLEFNGLIRSIGMAIHQRWSEIGTATVAAVERLLPVPELIYRKLGPYPFILSSTEITKDDADVVGPKAAKLAELARTPDADGEPIDTLPFSVVTTEALDHFLRTARLEAPLAAKLDLQDLEGKTLRYVLKAVVTTQNYAFAIEDRLAMARTIIQETAFPDGQLKKQMETAFEQEFESGRVAVRSSGREDGLNRAQAGTFLSLLGVSRSGLLPAIQAVWASQLTEQVLAVSGQDYFLDPQSYTRMAVIIQPLLPAEAAGVLLSRNPNRPDSTEALVEVTYGLGPGVVDSRLPVDTYLLDLETGKTVEQVVRRKNHQMVLNAAGELVAVPVEAAKQEKPALTSPARRRLAGIGAAVRKYFGYEIDLEFGVYKRKIVALQTRPLTVQEASTAARRTVLPSVAEFALTGQEQERLKSALIRLERYPSLKSFVDALRYVNWQRVAEFDGIAAPHFMTDGQKLLVNAAMLKRLNDGSVAELFEMAVHVRLAPYRTTELARRTLARELARKFDYFETLAQGQGPLNVLAICLGNSERSPFMAYLLERFAATHGFGEALRVSSRGVSVTTRNSEARSKSVERGAAHGIDQALSTHKRAALAPQDVAQADLIIGAESFILEDGLQAVENRSKTFLWGHLGGFGPGLFLGDLDDPAGDEAEGGIVMEAVADWVNHGLGPDLQAIAEARREKGGSPSLSSARKAITSVIAAVGLSLLLGPQVSEAQSVIHPSSTAESLANLSPILALASGLGLLLSWTMHGMRKMPTLRLRARRPESIRRPLTHALRAAA